MSEMHCGNARTHFELAVYKKKEKLLLPKSVRNEDPHTPPPPAPAYFAKSGRPQVQVELTGEGHRCGVGGQVEVDEGLGARGVGWLPITAQKLPQT